MHGSKTGACRTAIGTALRHMLEDATIPLPVPFEFSRLRMLAAVLPSGRRLTTLAVDLTAGFACTDPNGLTPREMEKLTEEDRGRLCALLSGADLADWPYDFFDRDADPEAEPVVLMLEFDEGVVRYTGFVREDDPRDGFRALCGSLLGVFR